MQIIPFASITEGASKINNIQQNCKQLNLSTFTDHAAGQTDTQSRNDDHEHPGPAEHTWNAEKRHMPPHFADGLLI